jgi:hypothetical protein
LFIKLAPTRKVALSAESRFATWLIRLIARALGFLITRTLFRGAEKVFSTSTVVAGGERTIMPHYDQNFGLIEDGALVIASASPRVSGYTSRKVSRLGKVILMRSFIRISRTWPVSGKFTTEQAEIYSIVLEVQNTILNMLKLLGLKKLILPGKVTKNSQLELAKNI